jgi:toxin CptA
LQQHFEFQPSRYLVILLAAMHGMAAAIVLLLNLPWEWKSALLAAVLASMLYYLLRDALLRLPSSCIGLFLGEQGGITLLRRDGRQVPCRILPASVVTPRLTVLNILAEGDCFKRTLVILPDSLKAELFRQLRVWLKWHQLAE